MGKPICLSSGVSRCVPQTTIPARPLARASSTVRSPMQPSSLRPPLSMTRISPEQADSIASRKTSTLPKCLAGSAWPAKRPPEITGRIPKGAIRGGKRKRSAASAINGVERSANFSDNPRLFVSFVIPSPAIAGRNLLLFLCRLSKRYHRPAHQQNETVIACLSRARAAGI